MKRIRFQSKGEEDEGKRSKKKKEILSEGPDEYLDSK